MSDEPERILEEFNQNALYESLVNTIFDELKEKNKAIIDKARSPGIFAESMIKTQPDAVPATAARDISLSALALMRPTYLSLRVNEGETHCDSLIVAQTDFVDFAYGVAMGHIKAENVESPLNPSIEKLESAFGNFRGYVGSIGSSEKEGDAKKYALFLAEVTHDVLSKVHRCKDLDKNLRELDNKYSL